MEKKVFDRRCRTNLFLFLQRQPGASEAERNVVLDAEMKQVRFRQQLKMFFDGMRMV